MSTTNPSRLPRVGFVVQRCGLEVNGGAEALCLQVAQRMAKYWDTEILTTCALDYMTWQNFYPEGVEKLGAITVRRFAVDQPRDVDAFNRLSSELHSRQDGASIAEQEQWMRAQGPLSNGLFEYLKANKDSYDAFFFFGYLYATTYFGLRLVQEKAFLVPCGHDEWTLHFTIWNRFFDLPCGFVFNTEAERQLLRQRFPEQGLTGPVIGIGIETPEAPDSSVFTRRYGLEVPFLLYVGRIDESKGCGRMFEYFIRWKEETGAPHELVLIGTEVMPIPFHDAIIHLGFVDDDQKWSALKACEWLIMPSPHESLSIVLLEAWSLGRPGLVNGECAVLVRHCEQSNGGVWYNSFDEWSAALSLIDAETKTILGRQGQRHVRQRYAWDKVESAYLAVLDSVNN